MKRGNLLTAPQVARHCNADLKTIHNWVNAGKIRYRRTPGRHLRFRPEDVVDFLESFGYPVPIALSATTQPKVVMITESSASAAKLAEELESVCQIKHFDCPVQALLAIGKDQPAVVVVDAEHPEVDSCSLIPKLVAVEPPKPILVVLTSRDEEKAELEELDLVAVAFKPDVQDLSEKISELLTQPDDGRVAAGVE